MKSVKVTASKIYDASIGGANDVYAPLLEKTAGKKLLIVTDENVEKFCLQDFLSRTGLKAETIVFPSGENTKSIETYEKVLNRLVTDKYTRTDAVIALGGGVIGDLAGFAAGTYMRGIGFHQVPTTLLAMIDSGVGGKCAVNCGGKKNMAGIFYQPDSVTVDVRYLDTLPPAEIKCGMGEGVKYAVLDGGIYDIYTADIMDRESFIAECLRYKADLVAEDEKDYGKRMLLNLGHTFGHFIESKSGFKASHGAAVAEGIRCAYELSRRLGIFKGDAGRMLKLLTARSSHIDYAEFINSLQADKKNMDGVQRFVLIKDIGKPVIVPMTAAQLTEAYGYKN